LRLTCEHCNRDLSPDSNRAMICSFEYTFCRDCVEAYFGDVCPNCVGGLSPRPIRLTNDWHNGNCSGNYPARTEIIHREKDVAAHKNFRNKLEAIAPQNRWPISLSVVRH